MSAHPLVILPWAEPLDRGDDAIGIGVSTPPAALGTAGMHAEDPVPSSEAEQRPLDTKRAGQRQALAEGPPEGARQDLG